MRDPLGNTIIFASTDKIEQYQAQVNRLLLIIGKYMGWDGDDICHVFVTDESSMSDFILKDYELVEISQSLGGIPVTQSSLLTDIVEAMNLKEVN